MSKKKVIDVSDIRPSLLREVVCPSCHQGNISLAAGKEKCEMCALEL